MPEKPKNGDGFESYYVWMNSDSKNSEGPKYKMPKPKSNKNLKPKNPEHIHVHPYPHPPLLPSIAQLLNLRVGDTITYAEADPEPIHVQRTLSRSMFEHLRNLPVRE